MKKRIVEIIMLTLLTVGISSPEIFASEIDLESEAQYTFETEDSSIELETDIISTQQDTNVPQNKADALENETSDKVINAETNSSTDQEYTYTVQRKSAKASSSKKNSKTRKSASRRKTTKRVKNKTKRKTTSPKTKRRKTTTRRTSSSSSSNNGSSMASNTTVINVEQYEKEVVDIVNQERKKAGVAELTIDSDLMEATDIRAKEIVSKFSHTRPSGEGFYTVFKEVGIDSYGYAGENIAWGQKTPAAVMDTWMNSSGHRKNILSANYERIGVGCCQGSDGKLYWVQLFYTPSDNDD